MSSQRAVEILWPWVDVSCVDLGAWPPLWHHGCLTFKSYFLVQGICREDDRHWKDWSKMIGFVEDEKKHVSSDSHSNHATWASQEDLLFLKTPGNLYIEAGQSLSTHSYYVSPGQGVRKGKGDKALRLAPGVWSSVTDKATGLVKWPILGFPLSQPSALVGIA